MFCEKSFTEDKYTCIYRRYIYILYIEECTRESFVTKCYNNNSNSTNLNSISFSTIHQQQQQPDLQKIFDAILDNQLVQQQQQHQPDLEFIFDNPQIHHQQQQQLDLQTIFDDILDNQQVQHQPDLDEILTENISSAEG